MTKTGIFILVRTYPDISNKYTETVCTAGILAENGKLVWLNPIRCPYLEGVQRFRSNTRSSPIAEKPYPILCQKAIMLKLNPFRSVPPFQQVIDGMKDVYSRVSN